MIFLSKNLQDEYINMFARGSGSVPVADFDYNASRDPVVLRGILKHKLMKKCWQDGRTFYYMDTGYFGNGKWKNWHRIVKNNLQHQDIIARPAKRFERLGLKLHPRRQGSKIVLALPDEKPCKFYNIDRNQWIYDTLQTIKQHTDRPIIMRERAARRIDRTQSDPLINLLVNDVHALVTFNSVAAVESVFAGVPAFVLAPCHAAKPVANSDLSAIDNPFWAEQDLRHAWACHLAHGQFHVDELRSGVAIRMLHAD